MGPLEESTRPGKVRRKMQLGAAKRFHAKTAEIHLKRGVSVELLERSAKILTVRKTQVLGKIAALSALFA
jgi:hypothetical protein